MRRRLGLLQERQKELKGELTALFNKLETEQRTAMTDEEIEADKKWSAELRDIEAEIERENRQLERERETPTGSPAGPSPLHPEPPAKFERFADQLYAVIGAAHGRGIDSRLGNFERLGAAGTGLNEGLSSDGGFLVQSDFSTQLLNKSMSTGILSSRVRRFPVSANSNGINLPMVDETSRATTRWGGIVAYWIGEGGTYTGSKPKLREVSLRLKKLTGLVYLTDEVLQDAAALEALVSEGVREEFGFQLDDAIVEGSGAGQPLGFMNAPCLVSVAKESGQAADTIVAENVDKMYARMPASSLGNAVWLINMECWPQLFKMAYTVGTGGIPVFLPPGGLADAPFGTLKGRPILPIEQASKLGDLGDIVFADLDQYIMLDKGGMEQASSIHVAFTTGEQVLRFTLRTDGQPIPNSALTPFKGNSGVTYSPFVSLAARA